jgi:hypothetical protein
MSTYTDRFASPSREEVAARVNGGLPGAGTAGNPARAVMVTDVTVTPEPEPQAGPLANFAKSLQARMRLLGWDQSDLQEKAGIKTPQIAARAINGTSCDLDLAGRIAALVGTDLAAMIGPYVCGTCDGSPLKGFRCLECEREGERG